MLFRSLSDIDNLSNLDKISRAVLLQEAYESVTIRGSGQMSLFEATAQLGTGASFVSGAPLPLTARRGP